MLVGGLVRAAKAWGGSMVMMARGAGRQSRPISGGLGWIDGGMRSDDTGGGVVTTAGWIATQRKLSIIGTWGVKKKGVIIGVIKGIELKMK
jgi:hypothetical protein